MLTHTDIHSFLTVKLQFVDSGGGSHARYRLYDGSKQVSIPTFPVLPRHKGDAGVVVRKTTAAAFGLNCHRLEIGAECGISAHCVYLCLAAKVLGVGMESFLLDPTTYQHVPRDVDGTASSVIKLAEACTPKWTAAGTEAVIAAAKQYLARVRTHCSGLSSFGRWQALASVGCGDKL